VKERRERERVCDIGSEKVWRVTTCIEGRETERQRDRETERQKKRG
jgi:hypothetical protein